MINEKNTKLYCCEDISLIENYDEAISSLDKYICHHKNEIIMQKSKNELIKLDLYFNRPANELVFMKQSEHKALHLSLRRKNTPLSEKQKNDIKNTLLGHAPTNKWYKWLTETGDIRIMRGTNAKRWHPNWKLIEESL